MVDAERRVLRPESAALLQVQARAAQESTSRVELASQAVLSAFSRRQLSPWARPAMVLVGYESGWGLLLQSRALQQSGLR